MNWLKNLYLKFQQAKRNRKDARKALEFELSIIKMGTELNRMKLSLIQDKAQLLKLKANSSAFAGRYDAEVAVLQKFIDTKEKAIIEIEGALTVVRVHEFLNDLRVERVT